MWVFTRPRGGQECCLLMGEIRGGLEFCPIHRFDGMDQSSVLKWDTPQNVGAKKKRAAGAFAFGKYNNYYTITTIIHLR